MERDSKSTGKTPGIVSLLAEKIEVANEGCDTGGTGPCDAGCVCDSGGDSGGCHDGGAGGDSDDGRRPL